MRIALLVCFFYPPSVNWVPFVGVEFRLHLKFVLSQLLVPLTAMSSGKSSSTVIYCPLLNLFQIPRAVSHFLFCALQIRLCYNDLFTAPSALVNCQFQAVLALRGGTLSNSPFYVPCPSTLFSLWKSCKPWWDGRGAEPPRSQRNSAGCWKLCKPNALSAC